MPREDKALVRDYTGTDSRYCAEVYAYGQDRGDRLAVAPLTPWAAVDMGMELIVLGLRALRQPKVLK